MKKQGVLTVAAATALLIAGCGGGGGSTASSGPAVSGGVMKGPVLGSTVCAFAVTNGAKGAQIAMTAASGASGTISNGCYVTGADGGYSFTLPSGTAGDVLIEATGGSFCDNEAQIANNACANGGTIVNLGATVMSSVVALGSSGTTTIYTTPLTTAAVSAAAAGTGFTSAAFNTQFNTLAGQIIGAGTSITPATQPTPTNQAYLTQIATFLKNGGTLTSAVNTLKQGSTSFSSSSASGNTAATVHASLVGSYNLQFKVDGGAGCGTVCDYTDGQSVAVTVAADGTLTVGNKVLTSPFYRSFGNGPHTPEIIWLDSAANVEYALSDNSTGTFNEINVGNASAPQNSYGTPRFLGQIRQAQGSGNSLVTAYAGSYPLAYQYRGNAVAWTGVTIGSDGSISFTGGAGPNIAAANIAQVYDRIGCCGRVDVEANFDLNGDNAVNGSDKISLYRDAAGNLRSIEYPGDVGVRVGTAQALPAHDGTAIPATNAINGTLDATVMNYAVSTIYGNANYFSLEGAAVGTGLQPMWLISVAPDTAIQQGATYDCRRNSSSHIYLNMRTGVGGSTITTDDGGRCKVTITKYTVSGLGIVELEGSFVAEFLGFSQAVTPKLVVNGVFRYQKP